VPFVVLLTKVLSIERNRIQVLPTTLADMTELRALTVAKNPLVFPPPEICNFDPELDSMEIWLAQLKEYMRSKGTTYDGNESGLVTRYRPPILTNEVTKNQMA
jgi:hypothetical protein